VGSGEQLADFSDTFPPRSIEVSHETVPKLTSIQTIVQ